MKHPVAIVLSVLFTASLCTAGARADAASDVYAAAKNFGAQKSVRATITSKDGSTMTMDMVEPNKMHGTSPQGYEFVAIGANTWVKMGGSWHAYNMGSSPYKTWMALARGDKFQKGSLSQCAFTDAGMSTANGAPAHKYHVVCKPNGNQSDVWIANGLPVKLADETGAIVWSNYNSVPNITAPM